MPLNQSKYRQVLERARKRYQQAVAAEQEIRREALIDLEFLAGQQWDQKVKRDRERGPSPRPCLVFNKVLPPVTQLGNQARQNKPAIRVNPVDSAGDPDTAKVLQGLIRHIEYDSDAEQAYDTALFYAAGCGFGYWRYTSEYTDNESFDQDLKTVTVDDPFSIYLDCYARKPDRSDAKWGFVLERFANDAFEARFGPDASDLSDEFATDLENEGWMDATSRLVAEYWEVQEVQKTLRMRREEDGTLHREYLEDLKEKDGLTDADIEAMDWATGPDGEILERTVSIPQVTQYIINGAQVLEEPTPWDGSTIPIVMVTGLEMIVRGERRIFSMTRFARDPQQLLNFYKTMEAETIALAPKPKWVGAVGQFKTKRKDWQRANSDNAAYLEYDAVAVGDKLAPEPQWRTFDPPVQALSIGAAAAADDIKASTGYFDPSLGAVKEDLSGVAVGKLQKQGDVSNFHFMDNLARALKRAGRILLDLIPKKYDTAREIRIIGEDQKQRVIRVNAPFTDQDGRTKHHRLDVGKYDVTVEQGPSYTSARQETRDTLMALAQGNPQLMQLVADIYFENSDFPGADRIAKRLKKMLPANLQDEDEHAIPPAIQAQLQQGQQLIQALTVENQQLLQLLKGKMLDIESKERMNTENNRTRLQVAETTAKSAQMTQLAQLDHAGVKHALDLRAELEHANLTIAADAAGQEREFQQAQQMQQAQQQHEQQQQQQQQQFDQQQAAQQAQAQQPAGPQAAQAA
jgi:hypothetical protein